MLSRPTIPQLVRLDRNRAEGHAGAGVVGAVHPAPRWPVASGPKARPGLANPAAGCAKLTMCRFRTEKPPAFPMAGVSLVAGAMTAPPGVVSR
jgi:hypothetical protein